MSDPTSDYRSTEILAEQLVQAIKQLDSCVVAFSGGVDSTVVAAAAFRALGKNAVAATAISASLPKAMHALSQKVASEIGIEHVLLETQEIQRSDYTKNDSQRCYYCKQELYQHLQQFARTRGLAEILAGTNQDDLADFRPGLRAAAEKSVKNPLADLGIPKKSVRELAHFWSLSVADEPAAPCLASRLAYGEAVTEEKLRAIDAAENFLRQLGFYENRVRYHPGELARIEVPKSQLDRLCTPQQFPLILEKFKALGFKFVTVDLEGFRSGNLNQLVIIHPPSSSLKA
jgi:pyridinium-3,5-biscarboxylic acid mononucleotide sulfurtransferase